MISNLNGLTALIELAKKDKTANAWSNLGTLHKQEVDMLKEKTGLDLTGYTRVLSVSEISHIMAGHGPKSKDRNPISFNDFILIPFIVANPDKVYRSAKNSKQNNLPVIVYEMKIGSSYVYVEEVRTGRKKLAILSFYKK